MITLFDKRKINWENKNVICKLFDMEKLLWYEWQKSLDNKYIIDRNFDTGGKMQLHSCK